MTKKKKAAAKTSGLKRDDDRYLHLLGLLSWGVQRRQHLINKRNPIVDSILFNWFGYKKMKLRAIDEEIDFIDRGSREIHKELETLATPRLDF